MSQQVVVPTPGLQVVTSLPASQATLISGSIPSQVVPHPYPGGAGPGKYFYFSVLYVIIEHYN